MGKAWMHMFHRRLQRSSFPTTAVKVALENRHKSFFSTMLDFLLSAPRTRKVIKLPEICFPLIPNNDDEKDPIEIQFVALIDLLD